MFCVLICVEKSQFYICDNLSVGFIDTQFKLRLYRFQRYDHLKIFEEMT